MRDFFAKFTKSFFQQFFKMDILRPISCLLSYNKVEEMAIVDMVVQDMASNLDPTQYGPVDRRPFPMKLHQ